MYQVPEQTLRILYDIANEYESMLNASAAMQEGDFTTVFTTDELAALNEARIMLGVNHEGERG